MLHRSTCIVFNCIVVSASVPNFPKEYEVELEMKMPYSGLVMPLRITTSATSQKIDSFHGLQIENSSSAGTLKYVWNNSKRVCLWSPPAGGPTMTSIGGDPQTLVVGQWKPSNVFPDLSQYTRAEDEYGTGFHKFVASKKHGVTGTMNDEMAFFWDSVSGKPIRWQAHARNPWKDSHTDVWIFEYLSVKPLRAEEVSTTLPEDCHPRTIPVNAQLHNLLSLFNSLTSERVEIDEAFGTFLSKHGKSYPPEEYTSRQRIFHLNSQLVAALNQQHAGRARFKGNAFLDLTPAEVSSLRGGTNSRLRQAGEEWPEHYLPFVRTHEHDVQTLASLPKDFDWRVKRPDAIARVKDQGICGSCWTFSFIAPLETMHAIQTGKLIELPEQFVLDCTWNFVSVAKGGNSACDGGDASFAALEIIRKYNGAVPTAKAYGEYLSADGYCKDTRQMEIGAWITGYVQIKPRDELGLLSALVSKGPISVGMIVPAEMNYYDSGVLNVESCRHDGGADIDHAVVLIAFGTDDTGTPYYTIRNSWSTYWGDEGYIKVVRGDLDCSIATVAGYAEVSAGPREAAGEHVILYA